MYDVSIVFIISIVYNYLYCIIVSPKLPNKYGTTDLYCRRPHYKQTCVQPQRQTSVLITNNPVYSLNDTPASSLQTNLCTASPTHQRPHYKQTCVQPQRQTSVLIRK